MQKTSNMQNQYLVHSGAKVQTSTQNPDLVKYLKCASIIMIILLILIFFIQMSILIQSKNNNSEQISSSIKFIKTPLFSKLDQIKNSLEHYFPKKIQYIQKKVQSLLFQNSEQSKQLKNLIETKFMNYKLQFQILKEQIFKLQKQIFKYHQIQLNNSSILHDMNYYNLELNKTTNNYIFQRKFPETPFQLLFEPQFKWYNKNLAHYILKNNFSSVLQVNCNYNCQIKYQSIQQYKKLKQKTRFLQAQQFIGQEINFDWIIIRNNYEDINQITLKCYQYAKKTKVGLALIFKNMVELKKFNQYQRSTIFQIINRKGLSYDQATSLNLRRREGQIILLFSYIAKTSSFPFEKPIKNLVAIQVVLKLNENLPYLRQWIGYHIYLGIDKFFIYDNNGTSGQPNKSTTAQNKYGFKLLQCLNLTDQKIIKEWDDIWEQFYEHIIYIPWQYLDQFGQITYAQVQSQADYINTFEDITTYTGFIDPDQMLISKKHLNFADYLVEKSSMGYTRVRFRQNKFVNRFCIPFMRQLEINQTFIAKTIGQAQKLFYQTDQFYPGKSIHSGQVYKGKTFNVFDFSQWSFNHYNLVQQLIIKLQDKKRSNSTKITYDNEGLTYTKVLDKICKGKCSQNFKVSCNLNGNDKKFKCPVEGKQYPLRSEFKIQAK